MIKCVKINIYGRVQGVGYRYSTLQKANEIKIYGFVKNRNDGSVYIEAEGEEEVLGQFVLWCKNGPSWSRVENVIVTDIPYNNYKEFVIK